jgi:hypothetical protein
MMKNTIYLFLSIFLVTVGLISCGEDSTTSGSTTPVGTVFFNIDTLGAEVSSPNSYNEQAQSFNQTIQATKVRVEYRLQSNGDTSECYARYLDSTSGTPSRPGEQLISSPVDSQYNYILDISSQPFYLGFKASVQTLGTSSMPYYMRFVGIKVTKVE